MNPERDIGDQRGPLIEPAFVSIAYDSDDDLDVSRSGVKYIPLRPFLSFLSDHVSFTLLGITAVDGPEGYVPYEPTPSLDDGTIALTGAIASFAYTPQASMEALKYFYRNLLDRLWSIYGFRDAFNLQQNWFAGIYMGLNQAPWL